MSSGTGTLPHHFWLLSFPRNGYSSKVPQLVQNCPSKFNFALWSSALPPDPVPLVRNKKQWLRCQICSLVQQTIAASLTANLRLASCRAFSHSISMQLYGQLQVLDYPYITLQGDIILLPQMFTSILQRHTVSFEVGSQTNFWFHAMHHFLEN